MLIVSSSTFIAIMSDISPDPSSSKIKLYPLPFIDSITLNWIVSSALDTPCDSFLILVLSQSYTIISSLLNFDIPLAVASQ